MSIWLIHYCFDQVAEQEYEKEKLSERIAKLSGGVAVIQVFAVSLKLLQFYYMKFSQFSSDCISGLKNKVNLFQKDILKHIVQSPNG